MANSIKNIHPGEILLNDFLLPMGISQSQLARDIGVPPHRINAIVRGQRPMTADSAVRLAHYFSTSERLWMNLQNAYELEKAHLKQSGLKDIIHPLRTKES